MRKEALKQSQLLAWISRLSSEDLPAFAHTARSLAYVSREEDSSANDLANVILHDSAMTARILRLANSVHYNASGHSIETVSYAIVVLGFEEVRNLALTISMIDSVLDSTHQEKVQHEMICAYHAAVQARRLVEKAGSQNLEAVYIGALLHRLGPIMFWCFPFAQGEQLLSHYHSGLSNQDSEKAVLGFTLNELTSGLVSEWNLSVMLDGALHGKGVKKRESETEDQAVRLGLGIAEGVSDGWQSSEFNSQLELVSKNLGVSLKEAREYIYAGAEIANQGLLAFGFPRSSALLPPEEAAIPEQPQKINQGADLELAILRQLTHMLGEDMDLNKIVMAVLEGVYRVLDMDNMMFAVVKRDTQQLLAKFMLGQGRDEVLNRKLLPGNGDYLAFLQKAESSFWHSEAVPAYRGTPDPLIHLLAATEYFVHPVVLKNRLLGIVYADRQVSKEAFSASNLQSFTHLCDHVTLAFKILSRLQ
jgi:hypothetical protein